MTDQDPTQPFEHPATPASSPPSPSAPPAAPDASPTSSYDPALAAAPTTVVAPATRGRAGRSKLKWAVALVVTVLVAGTAAAAAAVLTAGAGAPAIQAWVPSDTVTYAELRLDLPGSQQAELAKVLSAFPGFADQASFPAKMGEIGDRIVKGATDGKHDYQTEIAPWFDGQIGVAQGPSPTAAQVKTGDVAPRSLILVRVKDAGAATAWVNGLVAEHGGSVTQDTYNGTPVTVVHPKTGSDGSATGPGGMTVDFQGGYAIVGANVLVAGDTASVHAAIDTKGASGLATTDAFTQAEAAVPDDRLAFSFVNIDATLKQSSDMFGSLGAESEGVKTLSALLDAYQGLVPGWTAASLRAQDGNLVVDSYSPHVDALGAPANAASKLAGVAPPDTVLLATTADLGKRLDVLYDTLKDKPELKDAFTQVDQALGVVGGYEALVGWMGETGIAVTKSGDSVAGGLLIAPTDTAAPQRLVTQLKTFAALGGNLTLKEEPYGGTTIYSLDLSGLESMAGAASGGAAPSIPAGTTLSFAVTDEVVVIGVGNDFVKSVLDARTGPSLADDARFSSLLARAGTENSGLIWADLAGIRAIVEPRLTGEDKTKYETDIKPYLEPLDAVVGSTVAATDLDHTTLIVAIAH
jgi:hypothetical protein